MTDIERF